MKLFLIILTTIICNYFSIAQKTAKVPDKVRLIRAKSEDCDVRMDVTRLKVGYDIEYTNSSTIITVHFVDDAVQNLKLQFLFTIIDCY